MGYSGKVRVIMVALAKGNSNSRLAHQQHACIEFLVGLLSHHQVLLFACACAGVFFFACGLASGRKESL